MAHEINSITRGNDEIKRLGEYKLYRAAAGVTWHAVLQQTYK